MLEKILSPFTTAKASGVATRDITMMIGAILAILGALGFLTPEQVEALTSQAPVMFTAAGVILAGAVSTYRVLTKSSSDKAAEAAKKIDAELPASAKVEIVTPGDKPNIIVPGEKK